MLPCPSTPLTLKPWGALSVHRELAPGGKPLIHSVNGEERYLEGYLEGALLLAAEYGVAVIGMTLDDDGTPRRQPLD